MGLVIPQQSLRLSIRRVFKKTPKLHEAMVLSPFDVGKSDSDFDLLIVDETHRLNQRANQSSGMLNRDFKLINEKLFGADDPAKTQLDWIHAQQQATRFCCSMASRACAPPISQRSCFARS